jgi:hypothetical protein
MGQTGIHVTAVGAFTAISGVVASRNVKYGIGFSGDTRASVIRTRTDSNMLVGIYAEDGATVAITDSEASRNVQAGVHATTTTGTTRVSIDRFTSTGNQSGIDANAPGIGAVTIVDIVRANLSGNLTSGIEMLSRRPAGRSSLRSPTHRWRRTASGHLHVGAPEPQVELHDERQQDHQSLRRRDSQHREPGAVPDPPGEHDLGQHAERHGGADAARRPLARASSRFKHRPGKSTVRRLQRRPVIFDRCGAARGIATLPSSPPGATAAGGNP